MASETLNEVMNECAAINGERRRRQAEEWRLEQLLRAGWSQTLAPLVALDFEVDLHLACDLVERGCPPDTALKILL